MSVHTNLPIESIDKSIGIAILLTNNMGIGIANTLFISVGTVGIASTFPVLLIALVIDDISDSERCCNAFFRSDDDNDDWWHSALDCLELIPGGQDIYSRVVGDDGLSGAQMQMQTSDQRKRDLFYQMVGQYQCLPNALWPDCYSDLQMELYHLLMKDHLDLALKAFQLSLVILNKDVKQHIHQLVRFMRCAADDSQVRLCNKVF